MTRIPEHAVLGTLEYLMSLSRDEVRPGEAKSRMRELRQRHPETELELVWEEEAFERAVHYDALLQLQEGTVSLSFCPARALPWPLRGVHRWSEADLVRVNHAVLKVDQAIACLDFVWNEARIMDRLVNVCLIEQALEKDPVHLSAVEVQEAVDGFRRARGLCTAEATFRWMERHGITPEHLESLATDQAVVAKLRERVTAGRVEGYFERHRADFDTASIACLVLPDEAAAREVYAALCRGELDFYEAAARQFMTAGEREPASAGLFETLRRREAPPELRDVLFGAAPGELLSPVPFRDGSAVIRVLSVTPARLDDRTRGAIRNLLFDAWLEERRRAARIEWNWGTAARTSA